MVASTERLGVSRAKARQLLRPYLVPITALALAADGAAAMATAALYPDAATKPRYRTKTEGNHTAVLWAEAVRQWVLATGQPHLRLMEPFNWTELLVGDVLAGEVLHVRIQRDRARPMKPRRAIRNQQLPDPLLPSFVDPQQITNVDINAILSVTGRVRGVEAGAPFGKTRRGSGRLWQPINVPLGDARRLLASWRTRDVPWLDPIRRIEQVATVDDMLELITMMQREIDALHDQIRTGRIDTRGTTPIRRLDETEVEPARWAARVNPDAEQDGTDRTS